MELLMSNLYLRLLSSFFLVPLFLYLLFINNFFLKIFILILFIISIYELKFLIKKKLFFFLFSLLIIFVFSFFNIRGNTIGDYYFILWIILIVWLTDIGGFFIGKLVKGPKFSALSPKKTYSGAIGSIFFSQFSLLLINQFHIIFSYNYKIMLIQFLLSCISIFGDLFFSYIKRKYNIKDYSNIIPGHGGILDRIDGLIFVIIISNLLKILNVF